MVRSLPCSAILWKMWLVVFSTVLTSVALGQRTPPILENSFGYSLPGPAGCAVWWCEATYKVGQTRRVPDARLDAVEIEAARNEYEPFQIVLRPESLCSNVTVSVGDFLGLGGSQPSRIFATNVEVCLVEYVPVQHPTDTNCVIGPHPDPLIPVDGPFDLSAQTNQPLWFTVYVPKDAPSGRYEGLVRFQGPTISITVIVRLRVYDFTLSEVTHTKTAYYVSVDPVWHKPANTNDMRVVYDLYLENFRRHRVSPYSPHLYAPIKWGLTNGVFSIDFKDFDATMVRYLDSFGFNGFNLMGHKSPAFPKELEGSSAFSPHYRRLLGQLMGPILKHLRERGWMEAAYCYWDDEPHGSERFLHTLSGMDALAQCAPGLRRLMTFYVQPEQELDEQFDGQVEVRVPSANVFNNNMAKYESRRAAGDDIWWYVCNGPRAPYCNNFIDYSALQHRIRFWIAEKYGISGDLYWAVNYWEGRNPWTNTWSFANGDGVLLYPPSKTPPSEFLIAGPVNSIRWELTREALEDAEYFWLHQQFVNRATLRLGPTHPMVLAGQAARQEALGLVRTVVDCTQNPAELHAARRRMAEAMETMDDGFPMIVRQPVSKAVGLGENTTLWAEAIGWPVPAYQWRLNGRDIPSATGPTLELSRCGPAEVGEYTVVASNTVGFVISAAARVEGMWSEVPRIVGEPTGAARPERESAVFAVTSVSCKPMSYLWHFNGKALKGDSATRSTLLLTNLNSKQAGDYFVVISNFSGSVTSAVAKLKTLPSLRPHPWIRRFWQVETAILGALLLFIVAMPLFSLRKLNKPCMCNRERSYRSCCFPRERAYLVTMALTISSVFIAFQLNRSLNQTIGVFVVATLGFACVKWYYRTGRSKSGEDHPL